MKEQNDANFCENNEDTVFEKDYDPKRREKKQRIQYVISKNIEREKERMKRRYVVNHPVVKLLEKNIKKIYANEIFMNDQKFNEIKSFIGMAIDSSVKPRNSVYNELKFLNIKQRLHIKKKISKCSFNSTFYT